MGHEGLRLHQEEENVEENMGLQVPRGEEAGEPPSLVSISRSAIQDGQRGSHLILYSKAASFYPETSLQRKHLLAGPFQTKMHTSLESVNYRTPQIPIFLSSVL